MSTVASETRKRRAEDQSEVPTTKKARVSDGIYVVMTKN